MLNKEKVILMSKMAIYEKNEDKSYFKAGKYFREDYIGINLINTALVATLLYVMLLGAYVLVNVETILEDITTANLMGIGRKVLILYAIFIAVYIAVAYVFYSIKFRKAKKNLKEYDEKLKELFKITKEERKKKKDLWQEGNTNVTD